MDLSFIIVSFNTKELLANCLESVYRTAGDLEGEIIVVDNASSDGSQEMIKDRFPGVKLLANDTNRGFAAANNQAFRIMQGRYALLLNSDAALTPGAARELFDFMEGHPRAAIAGAQLLNANGTKQNSIAPFPGLPTLLGNETLLELLFPRRFPGKRREYREPIPVASVIGAAMIVRREALAEAGLFDERYFFFFEETDLARFLSQAGWSIYHVPRARIYHFQGKSVGHSLSSRILFYRSRYRYFRKWYGKAPFTFFCTLIAARLLVNWVLTSIANLATLGLVENLRVKWSVYTRLILWHLRGCP